MRYQNYNFKVTQSFKAQHTWPLILQSARHCQKDFQKALLSLGLQYFPSTCGGHREPKDKPFVFAFIWKSFSTSLNSPHFPTPFTIISI